MKNEKEFIDRGIEKLQERYNKKTLFSKAAEGGNNQEGEDEAAQVQTARGGRKSPTEIKIDRLKQTFSQNYAGIKKNGRLQVETKYNRLTVSNVTSPIRRSPLRGGESLD